jgi:hypothetical protein
VRRAEFEQKRRVEAVLIRCRRHLHGYDGTHFHTTSLVEFIRVSALELGGDLRLTDVRIAMQQQARHAFAPWRPEQPFELFECLTGAWIVNPAISQQALDTRFVFELRL